MPDVDFGALDRPAILVLEPGIDEQRRPRRRRAHDRAAVRRHRRMHAPERAEQARVGLDLAVVAVVEHADQLRQTERAGNQHRLVMGRVGMLAKLDDVGHRLAELLLGQLHLAGKVVQVAHEGRHDLLETRIGRALQLGQHRFGDVFLLFDDHGPAPARFRPQRMTEEEWCSVNSSGWLAAAARRQAGHRQSSPDSAAGIGRRTGSAAHQQSPPAGSRTPRRSARTSRRGRCGLASSCSSPRNQIPRFQKS